mgnify:FL=1|tara:strand:- start:1209 stop:1505 length:297 start_codon:yes stop_codon:yes gene_type:complete
MATNIEHNGLIENLKGNKVIDFQLFEDSKYNERKNFKKQFKREWNSNHDKIEKEMELKEKALKDLKEQWLESAFPDEKNIASFSFKYKIQIVIIAPTE